jgi:hypothetical protein
VTACKQEREMVRRQKIAGVKPPRSCFEHLSMKVEDGQLGQIQRILAFIDALVGIVCLLTQLSSQNVYYCVVMLWWRVIGKHH